MLHWLLSRTVREATDLYKHVGKLLQAQKDLLSPQAINAVTEAVQQTRALLATHPGQEAIRQQMAVLEKVANKWLKPYPHASWRENVEVFLVAICVAMAIRTFFLQPFKIPTGSMQPTLYGIEYEPIEKKPGFLGQVLDACSGGVFYHQIKAKADGQITGFDAPRRQIPFFNRLTIHVQYSDGRRESLPLRFAPEDIERFKLRAGLYKDMPFRAGEHIVNLMETAGDHLFVDRLTYNFRRPTRGEIIVFRTAGIQALPPNQFYIKRMVVTGGEKVRIGNDRHVRVQPPGATNWVTLDASTPRFENVYSFKETSLRLTPGTITNPEGLVRKLVEHNNLVTAEIWGQLTPSCQQLLQDAQAPLPRKRALLAEEFNRLLGSDCLFHSRQSEGSGLSKEVLDAMALPCRGVERIRHNRLLLEAAFEGMITSFQVSPPHESQYSGHVNGTVQGYAYLFPNDQAEFQARTNHYMVFGDNTLNSSDSRSWGDFSRSNVIGKSFFVYWPISKRFGWYHR